MGSSQSTNVATILILNDDCLCEVFGYLDLMDLCAVADVCKRFKSNAGNSIRYSRKKYLSLTDDIGCESDSPCQFMTKVAKVFRRFGPIFKSVDGHKMCKKYESWNEETKGLCRYRTVELIAEYCSGTLCGLAFSDIDLTGRLLCLMAPLLWRLQTLGLFDVKIGEDFVSILPYMAPKLRVLTLLLRENPNANLGNLRMRFTGLRRPFRSLEKFSLHFADTLQSRDIEMMLKWNPQLKELDIGGCRGLDHRIVDSIGKHASQILELKLDPTLLELADAERFGQMKNLKSLTFGFADPPTGLKHIVAAIHQIGKANIPLKKLSLYHTDCDLYADQLATEITNLKKLQVLVLSHVPGIDQTHIRNICKYTPELSQLVLQMELNLSAENISQIVRSASSKLELFSVGIVRGHSGHKTIDVDMGSYKEWMKIALGRIYKTPLQIHLHGALYTTKMTPTPATAPRTAFSVVIGRTRY